MANNQDKREYSVDEFIKMCEHIEKSDSVFVLANSLSSDGMANVLMSAKGSYDEIIIMIVEAMLKDNRINKVIQSSYDAYKKVIEQTKK